MLMAIPLVLLFMGAVWFTVGNNDPTAGLSVMVATISSLVALLIALHGAEQHQKDRNEDLIKEELQRQHTRRIAANVFGTQVKAWTSRRDLQQALSEIKRAKLMLSVSGLAYPISVKVLNIAASNKSSNDERTMRQLQNLSVHKNEIESLFSFRSLRKTTEIPVIWSRAYSDLAPALLGTEAVEFFVIMDSIWNNFQEACCTILTPSDVRTFADEYSSDYIDALIKCYAEFLQELEFILDSFIEKASQMAAALISHDGSSSLTTVPLDTEDLLKRSQNVDDRVLDIKHAYSLQKNREDLQQSKIDSEAYQEQLQKALQEVEEHEKRWDEYRNTAEDLLKNMLGETADDDDQKGT